MTELQIDAALAAKCLTTIDAGLVSGLGQPFLGQMCVEAAINFALGRHHGDDPGCVAESLRQLKIRLNDSGWSSPQARAKGLRRLALAQLGSLDHLDELTFVQAVAKSVIRKQVVMALRACAPMQKESHRAAILKAADACEANPCKETATEAKNAAAAANAAVYAAAYAANAAAANAAAAAAAANADANAAANAAVYAAAYAANVAANVAANADAKRDSVLAEFAEDAVQILIEMKAPGCQWLYLTEAA